MVYLRLVRDILDLDDRIMRYRPRGVPRRRQRRVLGIWVKNWLRRHEDLDQYQDPIAELYQGDKPTNFMQMSPEIFTEIERCLMPDLLRQTTLILKPLTPGLRLAIILRQLATGDSDISLQYTFRDAHSTSSCIVPEECDAIFRHHRDDYVGCLTCR